MHRLKLRRPSGSSAPWLIAIVAIVLAMGGTGLAAKKYLITSTSQISPKVLAKLHGARGARGPSGAAGQSGPAGAIGAAGAAGATGAAGSAKGYAEVLVSGSVQTVSNFGFGPNAARSPAGGTYCIVAPAGADPNGPVLLSLANANVGFVTQSVRTICNANEYQVLTADKAGALNSTISFNILAP
jgi:hypothetical protein